MKIYRLTDIPPRSDDVVFKASPTSALIGFIMFFGIGISLLLLGINGAKVYGLTPPAIFFSDAGAVTFVLFGWIAWGQFRARLRPTNWLMRCDSSGVIIKYRSFENWRFPAEDVQAVGFDYSEIAEIRMAKQQRIVPSLGGNQTKQVQHLTFLDFCLRNTDTATLEAHLQAEQKAEPPGRFKTIYGDYPVEVLPGGIVRVRWSMSGGYTIHPSPKKAIEYLNRFVNTTAIADSTKVDLTYESNLSPEEGDAKILKLARSGDKMGAVKLTRQIYGSTLSEAVAFVEKLQSGG
jgi:hypothetical protein